MNRIQIAGYSLIASAFFLGGLLLFTVAGRGVAPAQADMVIARDNFTLMTAQTRNGVESLFVLENNSGRLLVYNIDPRDDLELVANADMTEVFAPIANRTNGNERETRRGR